MGSVINYCCLGLLCCMFLFSCRKDQEITDDSKAPNGGDLSFIEEAFACVEGELIELSDGSIVKKIDTFYVYGGDIILIENQIGVLRTTFATKSTAMRDLTTRWPGGIIPYDIRGEFSDADLTLIGKAIDAFHQYTCIKFVPREDELDYIAIRSSETGCWSNLGKIGGKQEVNLQIPGCVSRVGTIIHELAHAVGAFHEQNRSDRDDYIVVHNENIQDGKEYNFDLLPVGSATVYGPFDFGSVMLYSSTAFTSNGRPTITRLDGGFYTGGQRDGLSKWDIIGINAIYKCTPSARYYNGYEHYLSEPNWEQLKKINGVIGGTRDGDGNFYFYPLQAGSIVRYNASLGEPVNWGNANGDPYIYSARIIPSYGEGVIVRKGESKGFDYIGLNEQGAEIAYPANTGVGNLVPGVFTYDYDRNLLYCGDMVFDDQFNLQNTFSYINPSTVESIVYWGENYKWTIKVDLTAQDISSFYVYQQSDKKDLLNRNNLYATIPVIGFCMAGATIVYEYNGKLVIVNAGNCSASVYSNASILILDPTGKINAQKYRIYQLSDAQWRQSTIPSFFCGGIWWKNKLMVYDQGYNKLYFEFPELKN